MQLADIPFWDIPNQDISWNEANSLAAVMPRNLTKEKLISSLIRIRKEANMTQDQVAKSLGKPQSFVSKYENGERSLDFIEVIEVVEAVGGDPIEELQKLLYT